ncbi:RNA polymerase factor sigma-32 [Pseudochrobactrum sp. HB0163]|uniref:RNA polymerase factor sigma-32 n=1 Tax=Pseudochrobactrum sp. HB0163 TaxID=3450708 RepID=UPI003F6E2D6B
MKPEASPVYSALTPSSVNYISSRHMMRHAMAAPYLERAQELALVQRWKKQGDQAALDQITTAHMRLVISVAARFRKFDLPLADLIQEGAVGLMEAALRFDPERDVRFSTYAVWWIRAAIQDYILRNWSIVRGGTSAAQKALFFNLRRLRARLAQTHETVNRQEIYRLISDQIGVCVQDVELMASRLSGADSSLDMSLSKDDHDSAGKIDFLVDEHPLQDEVVETMIDSERRVLWLEQALAVLNERELRIIRERRLQDEAVTLEMLGAKLGISKERVRQIENRALEKLRIALCRQSGFSGYHA